MDKTRESASLDWSLAEEHAEKYQTNNAIKETIGPYREKWSFYSTIKSKNFLLGSSIFYAIYQGGVS